MAKKKTAKKARSQRAPRRRRIPVDTKVAVLTEAGYRCAVPTCRGILALDLHHIVEVAEDGDNGLGNLVALCPTCHALFHRGEIRRESIAAWKGMLVSLGHAFDEDSIDLLLFIDVLGDSLPVSLDGLLRFARLVASGLVEVQDGSGYGDGRGDQFWTHIGLTDKGKALLKAWKAGDRSELESALSSPRPST